MFCQLTAQKLTHFIVACIYCLIVVCCFLIMSAPLEECSVVEQRSVVRFLLAEGVSPPDIHKRMLAQYGKSCMNLRNVYKWVERFKDGRFSVEDEHRSGRPVEVSTPSLQQRVDEMIKHNRRVTVEEIANAQSVSVGTAHSIVKNLNYRKTYARWVLKMLTSDHKSERLRICKVLKYRYQAQGDEFLTRIVTCDETWVHHFDPESKRQSLEWKHPESPVRKKFKSKPSAGKVLVTVFWDMEGVIFCDFLEDQRTVNSQYYSNLLLSKVKPALI